MKLLSVEAAELEAIFAYQHAVSADITLPVTFKPTKGACLRMRRTTTTYRGCQVRAAGSSADATAAQLLVLGQKPVAGFAAAWPIDSSCTA